MTTQQSASIGLRRLAIAYVASMLLISAAGVRASHLPRVILIGKVTDTRWGGACGCSQARLTIGSLQDIHLAAEGGALLGQDGYALVTGHFYSDAPASVNTSGRLARFGAVDSGAIQIVRWLRGHRALAFVVLLLLAVYGWDAISYAVAAIAAVITCAIAALVLSALAMHAGIGFPDLAWATTLTTAGCAGCHVARRFDGVIERNAQALVVSFAAALLLRDMAGVLGGIAGGALPALSKRVALALLAAVAGAISIELSDTIIQLVAASAFVLACLDRAGGFARMATVRW